MQMRWGIAATGVLGAAALLAGSLLAAPGPNGAAAEGELALPLAPENASGTLKRFDAAAQEAGCQAVGRGRAAGDVAAQYDPRARAVRFAIRLTGAPADADFLLDVAECGPGGQRLARGDGGHLHTDAQGNGVLAGVWAVQTDARSVRASLVGYCEAGGGAAPILPCGPAAFATDALLLPRG